MQIKNVKHEQQMNMVIEHDAVQNKYYKETSFILQMSEQSFIILN